MSRICQGCGGKLGVDCWNEIDCMEIGRRQEMDSIEHQDMLNRFYELESKIDLLENMLIAHGIPLPYDKPIIELNEWDDDEYEDWLPF